MLTGNLAMLSAMDSGMFSNMLKVLENRAGVFAKLIDIQERRALANMPQVAGPGGGVRVAGPGGGKKEDTSHIRDNRGETQLQKLDKVIALLTSMNEHVGTIDTFVQMNASKKNEDVGKQEG